jgi:transcriptional regulator with XRE-family HTH domain
MMPWMPVKETPIAIGSRRSRQLRQRIADELTAARITAGLSIRAVALRLGIGKSRIERFERGEPATMTIDLASRYAAIVGHQLAAAVYPFGDPVRDRVQLELLERLRRRLHAAVRMRTEVTIPIAGDPRSADAVLDGHNWDALMEAETRLGDVQLVERRARGKQRDLGADRVILLVSDTRHNREVIRLHPELRERFPIDTRTCLKRLAAGEDPGGDCLVIL